MGKSVRRRTVRRETRKQRIGRLNQSRRKGRKTLLNKRNRKRRASKKRRTSKRRRQSKRSKRRRIVGGAPKFFGRDINIKPTIYKCSNIACREIFWGINEGSAAAKAQRCAFKKGCPRFSGVTLKKLQKIDNMDVEKEKICRELDLDFYTATDEQITEKIREIEEDRERALMAGAVGVWTSNP
tara:strand:- start:254 stop:802 length:549 start_codon:yes stop_codon:yes gene_type:complete